MLGLMIALLLSQTASRAAAFCPQDSLLPSLFSLSSLRASLVTMSATNISGKTVVSVQESLDAFGSAKFVDGSWFLMGRNAREEYEAGPRIQGAHFFDIDDIASTGPELNPKNLKHMMPPKKLFEAAMDAMGISNEDHIILYGTHGCLTNHRAWFQMRSMGHDTDKFHLMQGSLDEWIQLGGPIEEGPKSAINSKDLDLSKPTVYKATGPHNIVDMQEILKIINQGDSSDSVIVDVRSKERYLGLVEEPRPGMRLGHMPGALNLPFIELLDQNDVSKFKSVDEMRKLVQDAGIDLHTDKKIVISCGSGATACALAAALEVCGRDPSGTLVYDGSWSEWGGESDTPIVKE